MVFSWPGLWIQIQQATYIYNGHEPEIEIKGFDKKLVGEGPVKGFVLDLSVLEID